MKARHSISTALMQSVAKIGTQSTMKSIRKTLHEFSPHIPPKMSKGGRKRIIKIFLQEKAAQTTKQKDGTLRV
jgi:hypothetical protein